MYNFYSALFKLAPRSRNVFKTEVTFYDIAFMRPSSIYTAKIML